MPSHLPPFAAPLRRIASGAGMSLPKRPGCRTHPLSSARALTPKPARFAAEFNVTVPRRLSSSFVGSLTAKNFAPEATFHALPFDGTSWTVA
jgi:hypothetical protein